jgi:hypothetical protein
VGVASGRAHLAEQLAGHFHGVAPETGIAEDDDEPVVRDAGDEAPRRFRYFQK